MFMLMMLLVQRIVPMLGADAARSASLMMMAIDELVHRDEGGDARLSALLSRLADLVARGEALLTNPKAIVDSWPATPSRALPLRQIDTDIEQAWRRLTALTDAVLRSLDGSDADKEKISFLAEAARLEIEQKLRSSAAAEKVHEATPLEKQIFGMADYFSARLGGEQVFTVKAVKQLSGGFSNQTLRVTLAAAGGAVRDIVVRLARAEGILWPCVASLAEEFPFIQFAHAAGFPAPCPLWLETDTSILDGVFVVTEHVKGEVVGSSIAAAKPISDELIVNFARTLAALHALPWRTAVGKLPQRFMPSDKVTITEAVEMMLGRLRDYRDASCLSPSPVTALLFAWLDANRPEDNGVPVITHGDLGFHNWLFDGDKPAALLDWETAMLCSPAKDLANVRDVVVDAPRWGLFLQTYIAAGGSAADDREMHYYGVLRQLQAVLCTSIAIEKMFTIADPLNLEYLELGIGARAYFYASVAAQLDALLASITQPSKR